MALNPQAQILYWVRSILMASPGPSWVIPAGMAIGGFSLVAAGLWCFRRYGVDWTDRIIAP
jgi:ABC-type polysaccharide/polyol phosphate export permease